MLHDLSSLNLVNSLHISSVNSALKLSDKIFKMKFSNLRWG
ncbi:hypothetical protein ABWED_0852 [Acinetobacter lwoffii]|nr:hypothetical protein ABWED_0852 [Acinetobacter lwoffii]